MSVERGGQVERGVQVDRKGQPYYIRGRDASGPYWTWMVMLKRLTGSQGSAIFAFQG